MASRLLARSKTLTLTPSLLRPSSIAAAASFSSSSVVRSQPFDSPPPAISSILGSPKNFLYGNTLYRWFSMKTQGGPISQVYDSAVKKAIVQAASNIKNEQIVEPSTHSKEKEVLCFSPLESVSTNMRSSGLVKESSKIKRLELSQKITYALIPALILTSNSSLTTSLLIVSVYWQIYGFFKEIFLDYVHHEVTRTWVLVYFKVLLLILVKDTIINFGLV